MRCEKVYGCWPRYTKKIGKHFIELFYMTQNEGLLEILFSSPIFCNMLEVIYE